MKARDQYFQVITEVEEQNGSEGMVKKVAKVASIRVVLFLEDLGPTSSAPSLSSNASKMSSSISPVRRQPIKATIAEA